MNFLHNGLNMVTYNIRCVPRMGVCYDIATLCNIAVTGLLKNGIFYNINFLFLFVRHFFLIRYLCHYLITPIKVFFVCLFQSSMQDLFLPILILFSAIPAAVGDYADLVVRSVLVRSVCCLL